MAVSRQSISPLRNCTELPIAEEQFVGIDEHRVLTHAGHHDNVERFMETLMGEDPIDEPTDEILKPFREERRRDREAYEARRAIIDEEARQAILNAEEDRVKAIADARSLAAQQALQTTVDEEEVEPREAQTLEDQSQVLESEDDVVAQVL